MSEGSRNLEEITVSFDLDGVLVKNFFIDHVFPRLLERYKKPLRLIGVKSLDDFLEEALRVHEERLEGNDPVSAFDWDGAVRDFISKDKESEKPFLEALLSALGEESPSLYPEVRPVLEELKKMDCLNLVVLTNGFVRYQKPILKSCGLLDSFSSVYGPDKIGFVKPEPGAFHHVKKREKNYLLHIGDKLETDIECAKSLELNSWLLKRDLSLERRRFLDISSGGDRQRILELAGKFPPRFLSSSLTPAPSVVSVLREEREAVS